LKMTRGEKVFSVFNYILMILITIITLYPVIYVAAASLSSPDRINMGDVWIFPKGFTIEAYKKMLTETGIPMGFANSVFLLIFGTAFQMFITLCGAYPLSRKDLPGKRAINFMVAVAMWLNPGLIPMYLNYHQLGMLDGRFMPDEKITREDCAVMLLNALKYKNVFAEGSVDVSDKQNISDYALSAVGALNSCGIINGYILDNGSKEFKPQGSATRAEAVKMISAFINYTEAR